MGISNIIKYFKNTSFLTFLSILIFVFIFIPLAIGIGTINGGNPYDKEAIPTYISAIIVLLITVILNGLSIYKIVKKLYEKNLFIYFSIIFKLVLELWFLYILITIIPPLLAIISGN